MRFISTLQSLFGDGSTPRVCLGSIPLFPLFPSLPFLNLPFSLKRADLATHLHIMGLTGMGKSKLLAQYASQLILQGRACAVLDPHADLVEDILLLLLQHGYFYRKDALQRVLYVDFADPARSVPFNILRQPYDSYTVARNLVEACTRAWPSLSGGAAPQFENLLLAGASVLIANKLPLTVLPRLLTDATLRDQLLRQVHDTQVLDFFCTRYERTGQLSESTLRRAFLLSYPPPLRYSLGQQENLLDFRALMDQQVSVLISLGGLDAQTQRLLGCLLTVGFEQAALSRADLPPPARRAYHLIIDEFSQFSAQSEEAFERVLALARKYGLFLVLAHQTWGQARGLQSALQNAMFLTFRVGPDDLSYAAARIGQINPYRIKYKTGGSSAHPPHPVYMSAAEQRAEWEYAIATLRPREAYLHVRRRAVHFTTVSLPRPSPFLLRQMRTLRARYAQRLLVPHQQIAETEMPHMPGATMAAAGTMGETALQLASQQRDFIPPTSPIAAPLVQPGSLAPNATYPPSPVMRARHTHTRVVPLPAADKVA
jgi:hypothetical protein